MRTAGSKVTRIASVCPSPSQTLSYVGAGVSPPVYPTRVATTPSSSLKMSSGFQNHPTPKYATLVVLGVVFPEDGRDAMRAHCGTGPHDGSSPSPALVLTTAWGEGVDTGSNPGIFGNFLGL